MDSGNSGSLQSSSGAEEECDSRAAVDPLSTPSFTTHHPPPPPFHHHIFDQNPFFFTPTISDHHFFTSATIPFPPATTTAATTTTTTTTPPPPRNPKKRSRASRRAPTTVLTTDTNNFRAMVQEFTGIPAPPFKSLTTGLDLFGRPSPIRSNSTHFDNLPQLPPYLRRPFPYKPPPSSSTMQNSILFPSNPPNQNPSFFTHKIPHSVLRANGFGGLEGVLDTTLPAAGSGGPVAAGNWDGGGGGSGVSYANGKESDHRGGPGMKGDHQGFIEPWICSSD